MIAELLMLLFFRGYKNKGSVLFTAGIYMPLSLPISVLFSIWLNGQSYEQLLARPTASIFTSLGTCARVHRQRQSAWKIAAELQKRQAQPDGEDGNACAVQSKKPGLPLVPSSRRCVCSCAECCFRRAFGRLRLPECCFCSAAASGCFAAHGK